MLPRSYVMPIIPDYISNDLIKIANDVQTKYGKIKLPNVYNNAVFHAHIEGAIKSLHKAANLLGHHHHQHELTELKEDIIVISIAIVGALILLSLM